MNGFGRRLSFDAAAFLFKIGARLRRKTHIPELTDDQQVAAILEDRLGLSFRYDVRSSIQFLGKLLLPLATLPERRMITSCS
jgi:hypothetical protein